MARWISSLDGNDLERGKRSEVACSDRAHPSLLGPIHLNRGELHSNVVFIADSDDEQPAPVISHRCDVGRELTAFAVTVSVKRLLEVEVGILPDPLVDEQLKLLLADPAERDPEDCPQAPAQPALNEEWTWEAVTALIISSSPAWGPAGAKCGRGDRSRELPSRLTPAPGSRRMG